MPEFMLEIVEGTEEGRRIPLSGPIELGRDPMIGASLLQDELVSARHVRVTPLDDGARVEDLGSRNGTFVDGDQIFSPAFIAPEGQLLVGVSVLQLRPTSEASAEDEARAARCSAGSRRASAATASCTCSRRRCTSA